MSTTRAEAPHCFFLSAKNQEGKLQLPVPIYIVDDLTNKKRTLCRQINFVVLILKLQDTGCWYAYEPDTLRLSIQINREHRFWVLLASLFCLLGYNNGETAWPR